MKCPKCENHKNCIVKNKMKDTSLCNFFLPADNRDEQGAREFLVDVLGSKFNNHILVKMPGGLACELAGFIKKLQQ